MREHGHVVYVPVYVASLGKKARVCERVCARALLHALYARRAAAFAVCMCHQCCVSSRPARGYDLGRISEGAPNLEDDVGVVDLRFCRRAEIGGLSAEQQRPAAARDHGRELGDARVDDFACRDWEGVRSESERDGHRHTRRWREGGRERRRERKTGLSVQKSK
eukprot:1781422-Pleurochrysis_carterae.AAC.1